MTQVGLIGAGIMGAAIGKNLLRSGFSLRVYNRSKDKAETLVKLGAILEDSPRAVAAKSDFIISMVGDPEALFSVMEGNLGVIAGLRKGAVMIDCSTVDPDTSRKLAKKVQEVGADFLDAPVTGSSNAVMEGRLVFMIGGKKEVFEKAKPILSQLGNKLHLMGDAGMGSAAKMANNMYMASMLECFFEGMALATKSGIDPEAMLEVYRSCSGCNDILEAKGNKILNGDFSPTIALKWASKDVRLAVELGKKQGMSLPAAEAVLQTLKRGEAAGLGEEDLGALIKLHEKSGNFDVRRKK